MTGMTGRKRFFFGGVGALMPIFLTVVTLDFVALASKPENFTPLNIVGVFIRYSVLFGIGGFIAYLHRKESEPFKLFELGIAAPALITSLVASSALRLDVTRAEGSAKSALLEPTTVFLLINSASAAASTGKDAVTNRSNFWSQIFDGITGKAYTQTATRPLDSGSGWVSAKNGSIPAGAVKGGNEKAPGSEDLYVCRARHMDGVHPGKVRPAFKGCDVPWGGKEFTIADYQVLTGEFQWASSSEGSIPAGAVRGGREAPLDQMNCTYAALL